MSDTVIQDARKAVGSRGEIIITNQEAYDEYIRLSNNPILNQDRFITVSDGRTLSLGYPRLKTAIASLPEDEQRKLIVRKKIYDKIHMKRNICYTQAYGTHVRHDGVAKAKKGIQSPMLQRKEEIIELFGRMFSIKEVHEVCLKEWDLKVTTGALVVFRDSNKQVILQKIEEYKRTYDNVRLGHKRPRLEELSWMFEKRKRLYASTGKVEDHRLMLQTLEQIRKEVEGDTLRIDGNMNVNLEMTIQNQVENDLMKYANIKEIIISRVSSRLGLDPVKMLTSIKNSFYAKRLAMVEDIKPEDVEYPSTQTYDFNRIEAINRQIEDRKETEQQTYLESQVISPEQMTVAERIKLALQSRLQKKKEDVNKIKNSVYFNTKDLE